MKLQAIRLIPGTKISHDIQGSGPSAQITSFTYQDLVNANIPAIGIHARHNRLVIIDVDVPNESGTGGHKHDGRPWWKHFCANNEVPLTYSVQSASGGYHFYYALPPHIEPSNFHPPGHLADGVDIKYNGFVGAPPTPGYRILYPQLKDGETFADAHDAIAVLPPSLYNEMVRVMTEGKPTTFEGGNAVAGLSRRTFSETQVAELKYKIRWIQENAVLNRDQWRDGIFSIKCGAWQDPVLLNDLITMWTCNRSFQQGDLELALDMAEKADINGRIGPGSIFAIINEVFLESGYIAPGATHTAVEILDKAGIIPDTDSKGKLRVSPTEANAAAIFGAMFPAEELYWDTRQDLYMYKGQPRSDADIVNAVIPTIQKPLAGFGLEKLGKRLLSDGLDVLMYSRQVDPHKDYLQNLRWDGVDRIETCLIDYLGVEDNEYNRRLGMNLFTSLAARGLQPGCKFDSVFVFEGHEGLKKSSFVEFLGGEYTYAPSSSDCFENLDCLRQMHQAAVVELPELKGLIDVEPETSKAFTAKPYDHIRGLWAKKAMKRLRGFIIIGTTNSSYYLEKDMGERRWWPIRVPKTSSGIDLAGLRTVRDQLFAEGVQRFRNGHKYWHMPDELLAPVVAARRVDNIIKDYIAELVGNSEGFTKLQIFGELAKAGVVAKKLTPALGRNIEESFKCLGFVPKEEKFRIIWVRPEQEKLEQWSHLKDLV